MGIKPQLTWILAGLFGLLILSTSTRLAAKSGYGLTVSPEKCFLLEKNSECEISVRFDWRVESKGGYCLFRQDQTRPIKCWQDKNSGYLDYLLLTNSDTKFELRTSLDRQLMYQTELKLFKQIKHFKKRRRNPWSFY